MTSVLFASGTWLHYVFGISMFVVAVFLILLVLVQRGRGGGLTGALGGMGGQSAFGTKAGDMFTRVTMVTAGVWILLCMFAIWFLGSQDEWGASDTARSGGAPAGATKPLEKDEASGSGSSPATGAAAGTGAAAKKGATGTGSAASGPAAAPAAGAGETKAPPAGDSAPAAASPAAAPKAKE